MNNKDQIFPPTTQGTWLGVMGGGQLGRMFVHQAQALGYKVAVLEPEQNCPAGQVADRHFLAEYDDPLALAEMASLCTAITTEFENVSAQSLAFLAQQCFVAPDASCVSVAQDRLLEKRFFTACSAESLIAPVAYCLITGAADIEQISAGVLPGILKTQRFGYDGKGQVRVETRAQVRAAFADMGEVACILEQMLPLAYEISVLVARGIDGQAVVYPIAENVHRDGILFTSTVPAPHISEETAQRAQAAALVIIQRLAYVGVLCIEFFVLHDGSLVINEMAPRPHNSGHYTMDACATSQFSQQVRAMARMPLGETRQYAPALMLNILGDVWFAEGSEQACEPAWDQILALPAAHLYLYGKAQARRARKMGHITFVAPSMVEVQQQCAMACDILGITR